MSSLLPRMVRRCLAITACCSTEQWFSKDRIKGYGDACREKHKKKVIKMQLYHVIEMQGIALLW